MSQGIRRRSLLGALGAVASGCATPTQEPGDIDIGQALCQRLGASGVFVNGFWDGKTRQRINVNRPTEQVIGPQSQVVREWRSDRAAAANARYVAAVKEAANGPLQVFYELHSNRRPEFAGSICLAEAIETARWDA